MAANLTELRKIWRQRLLTDGPLTSLLGGPLVYARDRRASPDVPSITMFDTVAHPSDTMPDITGQLQVDIWHTDRTQAAEIADRVVALLDFKQAGDNPVPPMDFSGVATIYQQSLATEVEQWSQEVLQKTLNFRFRGFQLT